MSVLERYRLLAANSRDIILFVGLDGQIIEANDSAVSAYGYSRDELLAMKIYDLRSPGAPGQTAAQMAEADSISGVLFETLHCRKDGSCFEVEVSSCGADINGQRVLLSIIRDISERKRAEEALRYTESRERARVAELQAFIDAVPGIVFIAHDPECQLMEGSAATYEFLRISPRKNVSKSAPDDETLLPFRVMKNNIEMLPEDLPVQQAAKGREIRDSEIDIVFNDGVVRTILGNARPVFDEHGNPQGAIGAFVDVTEQKRVEKELAELKADAERRASDLQAVLDAVPAAVWFAQDPECRQITGNAYADEIIMNVQRGGNVSHSALSDDMAVPYRVFRDGIELSPEELPAQVAATKAKPVADEEIDLLFSDGRTVNLLMGAVPLFDSEGRVRGSISVGSDITKLKQAETALLEAEAHKRDFYRRTIAAATGGKLEIVEHQDIQALKSKPVQKWTFTNPDEYRMAMKQAFESAENMGLEGDNLYRFMSCAGEMLGNAQKHAGGGDASLSLIDGRIVFMVSDKGKGIDSLNLPEVAFVLGYSTAGTGGLGYKMIIGCADKTYLATGSDGTTVAVEIDLSN